MTHKERAQITDSRAAGGSRAAAWMCRELSGASCPRCGRVGGGVARGMGSREWCLPEVGKGSVAASEPAWSWELLPC